MWSRRSSAPALAGEVVTNMRNARIKISFGVRPRTPHLEECGRCEDAIASYDRTIVLEPDEAAKDFLKDRLRAPR